MGSSRELVLGLDVSTSCTGVCVLNRAMVPDANGSHIVILDRIEFKKCKTLWDKADTVAAYLTGVHVTYSFGASWSIAVEEPLMGFRPGLSSAATIASLLRFNGIVSYISRNVFTVEPTYISSSHARKLCGMRMKKPSLAGMSHKEQVFEHMSKNDLQWKQWPLKKSGKVEDWSRDATDAYVIARAACLTTA